MKAVVFHAIGDIRLDDVPEPTLEKDTDAIVRLTGSAICGSCILKILPHCRRWSCFSTRRACIGWLMASAVLRQHTTV